MEEVFLVGKWWVFSFSHMKLRFGVRERSVDYCRAEAPKLGDLQKDDEDGPRYVASWLKLC